jgi:peroxiredoxin
MTEVAMGDVLDHHELETIHGDPVQIPEPEWLVHLQFRRFAGCPVCNLHLRSIAQRHGDVLAAGIREVVVFHSSAETMLELQGELPFAAIADPEKKLYAEFGVESSPKSVLHPRALLAAVRTFTSRSAWAMMMRQRGGAADKSEEYLGLPADFLIGPDGRVLAAKYGTYVDDQWSVDELLDLAEETTPLSTSHRSDALRRMNV